MAKLKLKSPTTLRTHRQRDALPEPVRPEVPYDCDVVIPFFSGDAQYVADCVDAIAQQRHAAPVIHLISDGAEFPDLRPLPPLVTLFAYRHRRRRAGQGPYRLTNALVRHGHCRTPYLAIQDADDLSLPDRLWRQISLLEQTGAHMISSAAENVVADPSDEAMQRRREREPIVFPGRIYPTVPRGRCVNPTRTMRLTLFERLNGFANLICTGDFEFDNRARFSAGVRVIDDRTILAQRRLRSNSLSHGIAPMRSPQRTKDIDQIFRSLDAVRGCANCAPNFGALRTAFPLEVL